MRYLPVVVLAAVVAEIAVLVLVAHHLGVAATVGLLVLNVIVGAWLLRREGRRTVREVTEAARLRRPPERGLGDGVITAAGGILVMVPGFLTDVVGLCCLVPITRAPLRRWLERAAERRSQAAFTSMAAGGWPGAAAAGWTAPGRGSSGAGTSGSSGRGSDRGSDRDDVIDGEVISVDEEDEPSSGHRAQRPLGRSAQAGRPAEGRER